MPPRKKRKPTRAWWNLAGHVLAKLQSSDGRTDLILYVGLFLSGFATLGIVDRIIVDPDDITPAEARFGWDEQVAKQEAPKLAALMPRFAIRDENGEILSGAGKSSELWRYTKLANGGVLPPCFRQESSDCVANGFATAMIHLQGYQIGRSQRNDVLKIPFRPYSYGTSRVQIGRRSLGRSGGSIGAWAAQAAITYGVLPTDTAEQMGYRYSGRLTDEWGWTGPPAETLQYAQQFRVKTVSQASSWEDVRDALAYGYPVTVASNVGFDGNSSYERDGKLFLRARGNWPHQMCFIGMEDRDGFYKGAYCMNSWGKDAHPTPLGDEPPGGFWVDWQTVQRMVGQGDSYAFSSFDGFPAENDDGADWNAFKLSAGLEQSPQLIQKVEAPAPQPVMQGVKKMIPLELLGIVAFMGVLLIVVSCTRRYGFTKKAGLVGALMVSAALIGVSDRAEAGFRKRLARQQQQVAASQCATCPGGVCADGNCAVTCENGFCRVTAKPGKRGSTAGIPADMLPSRKELKEFNAFAATDPGWSAFPQPMVAGANSSGGGKILRTYRDCYESEKNFTLVIGPETDATAQLSQDDKPVAHEASLADLQPGVYRVYDVNGTLTIEAVRVKASSQLAVYRP